MKYSRRILVSIFWVVLGVTLFGCGLTGWVDAFWSGMGSGLVVVGIMQIIRQIKYKTNEDYREKVDIEIKDERNRYLANKAWAWAGYLFVMIAAVASIGLKIAGYDDLVPIASGSICLMIVLYWGSYIWLKRKY